MIKYAVLRLQTTVTFNTFRSPEEEESSEFKINGIAGYIPVFDTLEQAEEYSENGTYDIVPMKVGEPTLYYRRCSKCGTAVASNHNQGGVCTLPMAGRISGICGGTYDIIITKEEYENESNSQA